jgi:hypothetical protein
MSTKNTKREKQQQQQQQAPIQSSPHELGNFKPKQNEV